MSNKTAACIAAFVAGAAIGSLATYKIVRDKFQKISQEETEALRARFAGGYSDENSQEPEKDAPNPETPKTEPAFTPDEKEAYSDVVKKLGYTDYSAMATSEYESERANTEDGPTIIDPSEFGEYEDYMQISLLFHADHILADLDGNIVDDPEELIGRDALHHFGEYEEDAVHVRNDARKCYYEILMDGHMYSDVLRKKPYLKDRMEN